MAELLINILVNQGTYHSLLVVQTSQFTSNNGLLQPLVAQSAGEPFDTFHLCGIHLLCLLLQFHKFITPGNRASITTHLSCCCVVEDDCNAPRFTTARNFPRIFTKISRTFGDSIFSNSISIIFAISVSKFLLPLDLTRNSRVIHLPSLLQQN